MIEIEADFGTTVRGGLIRAYRDDGPSIALGIGDIVRATDPDEGLAYFGTVHEIEGPFIYLLMHWNDTVNPVVVLGGTRFTVATPFSESTGGAGRPDERQTSRLRLPVAV